MKRISLFILALLAIQVLLAQEDYLNTARDCFNKGDYDCVVRNYKNYQLIGTTDVSSQIATAE